MVLVPRTNTRGRGEYPQASEQTIVKELGKLMLGKPMPQEKARATVYQKHSSLLTRKRMYRGCRLPSAPRLREGVSQ